jgi:hypothetical protein
VLQALQQTGFKEKWCVTNVQKTNQGKERANKRSTLLASKQLEKLSTHTKPAAQGRV